MSDTTLCGQLKQKGVTDIYVCGLAYDVCVGEFCDNRERESVILIKNSILRIEWLCGDVTLSTSSWIFFLLSSQSISILKLLLSLNQKFLLSLNQNSFLMMTNFLMQFLHFTLGATATDSLSAGYRTILIDDCCRGVDMTDIESTKETVLGNHGVIVHSREVQKKILFSFLPFFHILLPFFPFPRSNHKSHITSVTITCRATFVAPTHVFFFQK